MKTRTKLRFLSLLWEAFIKNPRHQMQLVHCSR